MTKKDKAKPAVTRSGVIRKKSQPDALQFKGNAPPGRRALDLESIRDSGVASRWHMLHVPTREHPGAGGIGIELDAEGGYAARFALELATVSSAAAASDEHRVRHNDLLGVGESQRAGALRALVATIRPSQSIAFIHLLKPDGQGRLGYVLQIEGCACACEIDVALDDALALQGDLLATLATGCSQFGFRALTEPEMPLPFPAENERIIMPEGLALDLGKRGAPGFAAEAKPIAESLWFPFESALHQSYLDSVVSGVLAMDFTMELCVKLTGRVVPEPIRERVQTATTLLSSVELARLAVASTESNAAKPSAADLDGVQALFSGWATRPAGVDMIITIRSEQPVPSVLLRVFGDEILRGRPFSLHKPGEKSVDSSIIDLRRYLPANACMPPLLPAPSSLARIGFPQHFTGVRVRTLPSGIVLGDIPTAFFDQEIRLDGADAAQHCYVIGSTGTGKSTLLENQIVQVMEQGHGVALLDPHGDLYQRVLEQIPVRRRSDVVLLDFTHFDRLPGLNLLETRSARPRIERTFIINDLIALFQRMYVDNPEAFGPMFQTYMRNAVALAMECPAKTATLLDVPRVFADRAYRLELLKRTSDKALLEFWRGIATMAGGDAALENVAPYITCKLTEFTQNDLVRVIVGQPRSTINFRALMDQRKIVLVNLSKGLLSEQDSRFIGMLITSRMFYAATTRAELSPRRRVPFHIFIDEFQNFTSNSLTSILSEARKYGVSLTLAHQDQGQLERTLLSSVMTNTGSKILFRVGPADAMELAKYMAPNYSPEDLMSLADHHAIARIKIANIPSAPFLLRSRPPRKYAISKVEQQALDRMIRKSRESYCSLTSEVLKDIDQP